MLKLFEVSGFKNFGSKITFDFSNVSDYKFNPECIENNTISKAIVYGRNSIGKTNLGLAMFDIVSTLTDKYVDPTLYDYYLIAGNTTGYAEFHYVFQFGNDTVDYTYQKASLKKVIYERMSVNGNILFMCIPNKIDFDVVLTDLISVPQKSPNIEEISYLRYLVNNTPMDENVILKKTVDFVSKMLWFRNETKCIGYLSNYPEYFTFITKPDLVNEFQNLLNKTGLEDKLKVIRDADGQERLYIGTEPPLPFFSVVSNGTKALYTFFYWLKVAQNASVIFIDEFDAYYHYELSETIVEMLEAMTGVQIILTSHNTNLLSNKIMRPDCYFILSKDRLTSLKNATDRELREGHNLEKLYMSGEFGGK